MPEIRYSPTKVALHATAPLQANCMCERWVIEGVFPVWVLKKMESVSEYEQLDSPLCAAFR
jgi:hypothetical protein